MKKDNSIPEKLTPFKTKYKLYSFLVCLLFSTLIWSIIKLSKEYSFTTEIRVDFKNVPTDKYIEKADTSITASLAASGFMLLRENFNDVSRISVDVSKLMMHENAAGQTTAVVRVERKIKELYPFNYRLLNFSPLQLELSLRPAVSRKVPVVPNIDYQAESQHFVYGSITATPDSVTIHGPSSSVKKINRLYTKEIEAGTLSASQTLTAPLVRPAKTQLHLSHEKVSIHIPVERFTEAELSVPISDDFTGKEKQLKLFPTQAKLTFLVAVKDFNSIEASHFKLEVDTTFLSKNEHLPINVTKMPPNITITKITPPSVEYIFIK